MTYVSQFGWPGDGGIGERLIQQILQGQKTATCSPMSSVSAEELAAMHAAVGTVIDVTDSEGKVRAYVHLESVYETTFGKPTAGLLAGEGFAGDLQGFQSAHRQAWRSYFDGVEGCLDDDTRLIVEEFELVNAR